MAKALYRDRTKRPKGAQPGTLRYWQARMEVTIAAMEAGKITSTECERRCRIYIAAMQSQTALKTLKMQGVEDEVDLVSAELEAEEVAVAHSKTTTIKRGNTPKGPVDEITEVIEGVAVTGGEE